MTFAEYFAGQEFSRQLFDVIRLQIEALGPAEMRVTKSQIAFKRSKSFAWLWMPGKYLRRAAAPLVLSLSFGFRLESPRWKSIVEPYPGRFMHHLEINSLDVFDDEVRRWLQLAWEAAV